MARCEHRHEDGRQCGGHAMRGSAYCFFHDPERREQMVEAARRGGSRVRKHRPPESASSHRVTRLRDARDAARLLAETIEALRRGEMESHIARTVGYLVSVLLKAYEQGEWMERLDALEEQVRHLTSTAGVTESGDGGYRV